MEFVYQGLSLSPAHSHSGFICNFGVSGHHLPCYDFAWASKYSFLDQHSLRLLNISVSVLHLGWPEWLLWTEPLSLVTLISALCKDEFAYPSPPPDPEFLEGRGHIIFPLSVPGMMHTLGAQWLRASPAGAWSTFRRIKKSTEETHSSLNRLQEDHLGFWSQEGFCLQRNSVMALCSLR